MLRKNSASLNGFREEERIYSKRFEVEYDETSCVKTRMNIKEKLVALCFESGVSSGNFEEVVPKWFSNTEEKYRT